MKLFTLYLGSLSGQAQTIESVTAKVGRRFESFTLTEAHGVFRGVSERMWLIRIATDGTETVLELAAELREQWKQDGVGIELAGSYFRVTAETDLRELMGALDCLGKPTDSMNPGARDHSPHLR
jgi:hypothetical protein